jgi:hypothetical protein
LGGVHIDEDQRQIQKNKRDKRRKAAPSKTSLKREKTKQKEQRGVQLLEA